MPPASTPRLSILLGLEELALKGRALYFGLFLNADIPHDGLDQGAILTRHQGQAHFRGKFAAIAGLVVPLEPLGLPLEHAADVPFGRFPAGPARGLEGGAEFPGGHGEEALPRQAEEPHRRLVHIHVAIPLMQEVGIRGLFEELVEPCLFGFQVPPGLQAIHHQTRGPGQALQGLDPLVRNHHMALIAKGRSEEGGHDLPLMGQGDTHEGPVGPFGKIGNLGMPFAVGDMQALVPEV